MTKTKNTKRGYTRNPDEIAEGFTISLRPDRIQWVRTEAKTRNVAISDVVRDLIDAARMQAERESIGMSA